MKAISNTLFWLLTVTYLTVCPAVILFAIGHLNSGIVTLSIVPAEARATIAGRELQKPWPGTVVNLSPGKYQLEVESPGFSPISRTVNVAAGTVTRLDHLLLLPDSPQPATIAGESFADLIPLPGTTQLLLQRSSKGATSGLLIYDWKTTTLRKVFRKNSPYAVGQIARIDTMENSSQAIVWIHKGDQYIGVVTDLKSKPALTRTDPRLLVKQLPATFWIAAKPSTVYLAQDGEVTPVFGKWRDTAGLGAPDARWRAVGIGDDKLFAIDEEYRLRRFAADGLSLDPLAPSNAAHEDKARQMFGERDFYRILPNDNKSCFFIDDQGRLTQNQQPHLLAEEGVVGVKLYRLPKGPDRTLVWTAQSVGIIDEPVVNKTASQLDAGQLVDGRELRWFFETGKRVSSAHLLHDGSHALVADDDRVLLFELFPGAEKSGREVLQIKPGTAVAYAEDISTLFYIGAEAGHCEALRLLPKDDTVELSALALD